MANLRAHGDEQLQLHAVRLHRNRIRFPDVVEGQAAQGRGNGERADHDHIEAQKSEGQAEMRDVLGLKNTYL